MRTQTSQSSALQTVGWLLSLVIALAPRALRAEPDLRMPSLATLLASDPRAVAVADELFLQLDDPAGSWLTHNVLAQRETRLIDPVSLRTRAESGSHGLMTNLASASPGRFEFDLDAGYQPVGEGSHNLRRRTYGLLLGVSTSLPLGDRDRRALLVYGNSFARQSPLRGAATIVGLEAGTRYLTERQWTLGIGVGSDLTGSREADVYARFGVSREF